GPVSVRACRSTPDCRDCATAAAGARQASGLQGRTATMAKIERIGILTSGGDCAGLNPVIRAVVSRATGLGWTVVGIRNGTAGLLPRPGEAVELDRRATGSDMLPLRRPHPRPPKQGGPPPLPTP